MASTHNLYLTDKDGSINCPEQIEDASLGTQQRSDLSSLYPDCILISVSVLNKGDPKFYLR